jgi:hypothetical protein
VKTVCNSKTLFRDRKDKDKDTKELYEAIILEDNIDLEIVSGLAALAKAKGDTKQLKLLVKKEKSLKKIIRKHKKYIDIFKKKEPKSAKLRKYEKNTDAIKTNEVKSSKSINIKEREVNLVKNKKHITKETPIDNSKILAVINQMKKKIKKRKRQAIKNGNKREIKRLEKKEKALNRRANVLKEEDRNRIAKAEKTEREKRALNRRNRMLEEKKLKYKIKDKKINIVKKNIPKKKKEIIKENSKKTKIIVDKESGEEGIYKNLFIGTNLGSSLGSLKSSWDVTPARKSEPTTSATSSFGIYGGYRGYNYRVLADFNYHLWSNSSLMFATIQGDYISPKKTFDGNLFIGTFAGVGNFNTALTNSSGSGTVYGVDFGYIRSINNNYQIEIGSKYILTSIEAQDSEHTVSIESIINLFVGLNWLF